MTSYAGLLTEFEAYARDGIEDEMLTRRLKDVYKRQVIYNGNRVG